MVICGGAATFRSPVFGAGCPEYTSFLPTELLYTYPWKTRLVAQQAVIKSGDKEALFFSWAVFSQSVLGEHDSQHGLRLQAEEAVPASGRSLSCRIPLSGLEASSAFESGFILLVQFLFPSSLTPEISSYRCTSAYLWLPVPFLKAEQQHSLGSGTVSITGVAAPCVSSPHPHLSFKPFRAVTATCCRGKWKGLLTQRVAAPAVFTVPPWPPLWLCYRA